jgi:transcriptional regulator with XRE-family HTH domain
MTGRDGHGVARTPVGHFGRQVKRERTARGWTITELAQRSGIAAPHLGRIESGKRPPTERVAAAMDRVFPERGGYFTEYYEESRTWMPAGFRDWPELEIRARRLCVWSPGIIDGLLQTPDYARAVLSVSGAAPEVVSARLAGRMQRQQRVLLRDDDPPSAWFVIDLIALYREVGSPEVMAGQCAYLAELAGRPGVTLTVIPAVLHPANESGFILTEDAAYAENVVSGGVYTEDLTVTDIASRFDTLRAESHRASDSLAIIERTAKLWTTGVSPLTAAATAASA